MRGLRLGEFAVERRRARAKALKEALGKAGLLDSLLPLGKHAFGFMDEDEDKEEDEENEVHDGGEINLDDTRNGGVDRDEA